MQYKIALAGNPNSGKTTLFNELTGANAHVGNWPGVTVEKKEGKILKLQEAVLVDLPGIYSLSPYTLEELVAREFLLTEKPDLIINIVDASNLERNLYLTTQILELGIPTLVVANMIDILEKRGEKFDADRLSGELGVPVVEISALRAKGMDKLIKALKEMVHDASVPGFRLNYGEDLERLLAAIRDRDLRLFDQEGGADIDPRWYAIKLFEQDEKLLESRKLSERSLAEIRNLEDELGESGQSLVSLKRYAYIASLIPLVCPNPVGREASLTDRIDRIVTNRWLGLPIFAVVIFIVYYLSIQTVGTMATDYVNDVVIGEWAQGGAYELLTGLDASGWLVGLIVDGIIAGVGAVLGFLPQMAVLFILLTILEQCGYMARIAFILDRIFSSFGLSGKSFIPMLVGTGCSVPGIMAARTIENEADRRITAITTSFMPCSAKLPIIAFIAGAFYKGVWWFAPICYFLGIGAVIFSGVILKKTRSLSGDPTPFVMELPEYRLPTFKGIVRTVWEKVYSFIQKAGTIILLSSIILWFLQSYGWGPEGLIEVGEEADRSFLALIGGSIAWIFSPLGFGDWQSTVASFTGLIAKENIMTSFAIIFRLGGDALEMIDGEQWNALAAIANHYTAISAFSFLSFNLLCVPCFAAIGAMHRELGSAKWTWIGIAYQMAIAYSFSLIFYQLSSLLAGAGFTLMTLIALVVLASWLYLLFRPKPKSRLQYQPEMG